MEFSIAVIVIILFIFVMQWLSKYELIKKFKQSENKALIIIAAAAILALVLAFVPIPGLCGACNGGGIYTGTVIKGQCSRCGGSGAVTVWKRMNP